MNIIMPHFIKTEFLLISFTYLSKVKSFVHVSILKQEAVVMAAV